MCLRNPQHKLRMRKKYAQEWSIIMQKKFQKNIVTQIGILTSDIQKSKKVWEQFLKLPEQKIFECDGYEKTQAIYRGEPMHGRIFQVCFNFDNIELELIQPIGDTPSYWKECLDKNGEGIHHIAFAVKDMNSCIGECEDLGLTLTQKGEFEGGRYAYLDAMASMNIVLELLEKDQEVL